jgi:haloalkane dehalogenase
MTDPIAAELFPYRSHEIDVSGHRLRYIDEGPRGRSEGEAATTPQTILCVHGNPTWSFYWRRVIERFSPRYRVIAVDHLGCGRSEKPPRGQFPYTLTAHRDNLLELIDQLGLQQINLLAHDWGGAIGLSALLERRDRFDRIMLLNTGAFPPPYVPLRIAACRTPLLGTLAVRGLNLFAKAAVRMAMSRQVMDNEVARGLLAPYDCWANRVAIDAFVRDIPMSRRHPTFAALQTLEARLRDLKRFPALLVWGMQDWCFRPECLRRFQQAWPAAETLEISDAGHYVMEDAPEETLERIANFLGDRQAAGDPLGAAAANPARSADPIGKPGAGDQLKLGEGQTMVCRRGDDG